MQVRSSIILFTVGTVFAACVLLPAFASLRNPDTLTVSLNPVSGTQAQRITFPDLVTPQSLKRVEQVENRRDQIELRFVKKPKSAPLPQGTREIWIPENGSFKVRYKAGNRFAVLDPDGTDGEAVVQMPANQLREGFTQVRGPRTREQLRSLIVQDELYHIKQELVRNDEGPGSFNVTTNTSKPPELKKLDLNSVCSEDPDEYRLWKIDNPNDVPVSYDWEVEGTDQKGTDVAPAGVSYLETETETGDNRVSLSTEGKKDLTRASVPTTCEEGKEPNAGKWWRFGIRKFPIPADWHGPDGPDYVMRFSIQNVPSFTFKWAQTTATKVDFPAGIAEIGPEGGTIGLPGVAEIQFPQGALNTLTTICITQELKGFEDIVMLSPIIRFEPFGLQLNKPALVRMNINAELVGKNHPVVAGYDYYDPDDPYGYIWKGLISVDEIENITLHSWNKLPKLTRLFVKMPPYALHQNYQPSKSIDFQINANTSKCNSTLSHSSNFLWLYNDPNPRGKIYEEITLCALNRAWDTYIPWFGSQNPPLHFHCCFGKFRMPQTA